MNKIFFNEFAEKLKIQLCKTYCTLKIAKDLIRGPQLLIVFFTLEIHFEFIMLLGKSLWYLQMTENS